MLHDYFTIIVIRQKHVVRNCFYDINLNRAMNYNGYFIYAYKICSFQDILKPLVCIFNEGGTTSWIS